MSLGKNLKLVSYDNGRIWYPEFYDLDTVLGLNNTGFLVHDSSIEVESGIFMTNSSVLWQKLRKLFQAELRDEYAKMRLSRFTVDNFMKYLHGTQISKIPEVNYNKDAQVKYLNFGPDFLFACHGNRYHHMKKWIRERLVYIDTLMGYTGSTSDYITIRANKMGNVSLWLETYIPMYLTVKWRDVPDQVVGGQIVNPGKTIKRVGRNEKVRFDGYINADTDQNVIIYAGRYLKSIDGISALRPSALLLAPATKLTTLECHSDLLIESSVSAMTNLQYIDFGGSKVFGDANATEAGQKLLDLTRCKYIKKVDISGTSLTALDININGGSVEELIYPTGVQSIVLTNQPRLKYIGLPYGYRNLLRNSEPVAGTKYTFANSTDPTKIPSIDHPVITVSASHLTFINPIKIINNQLYKIKASKSGGVVVINEFDIDGSLIKTVTISMQASALVDYTSDISVNTIVVVAANTGAWTTSDMQNLRIETESNINIFDECKALQTFSLSNCPNLSRFTQYPYPVESYEFSPIKYVQNLIIINSLALTKMNFSGFTKLRKLELSGLSDLVTIGFNDMNNTGDSGMLNDVKISNCSKIETIEMNVTSASKSVVFTYGATMDLGNLYTLKSINANTPIIGLETLILNRDIQDLVLKKEFVQSWDSDIKNIWSYSSATANKNSGYVGIDFDSIRIKNIDLSATKKIPFTKNFNIELSDIFNINTTRDGVIYPYLLMNGTIDMTNYTGSCVRLFQNCDLRNVNLICNKDLTQTDFTSMFEGAIFGDCDLTSIFNRIKNASNCNRMFAYSDVKNINVINLITFGENPNISYMFEGCNLPSDTKFTIPNGVTQINGLFKNVTTLTEPPITIIPDSVLGISDLYSGCTGIQSVNGMIFGSGINSSTNWYPPNLDTANNITIKNNYITFQNNKGIKYCNNLTFASNRISLVNMFSGCSNLLEVSFSVDNDTSKVTDASNTFYGCTSLIVLNLSNLNLINCENISNMFKKCMSITSIIFKNVKVLNSAIDFMVESSISEIVFTGECLRNPIRTVLASAPWNIKVIYNGVNVVQSSIIKEFSRGAISHPNSLERSTRDIEIQGETYINLAQNGEPFVNTAIEASATMPVSGGVHLADAERSFFSAALGEFDAEILEISFNTHKSTMVATDIGKCNYHYNIITGTDGVKSYEHIIVNDTFKCNFTIPVELIGCGVSNTSISNKDRLRCNFMYWSDLLNCYCVDERSIRCKVVSGASDIVVVGNYVDKYTGEALTGYRITIPEIYGGNKVDFMFNTWWNYNIVVDNLKACGYWYQEYNVAYGHSASTGKALEIALPTALYNTPALVYEFLKDAYGFFPLKATYYLTTPLPSMNKKLKIRLKQGNNIFKTKNGQHISGIQIESKALNLKCMVKPSTSYYVQLDGSRTGSTPISVVLGGAIASQMLNTTTSTFNIPITTTNSVTNQMLIVQGVGSNVGKIKLFETRTSPQILPYLKGINSLGDYDARGGVYKVTIVSSNSDNSEINKKQLLLPNQLKRIMTLYDTLNWDESNNIYSIAKKIDKVILDSSYTIGWKSGTNGPAITLSKPFNARGFVDRTPYLMCSHLNNLSFDVTDNVITFSHGENPHIPGLLGTQSDIETIKRYFEDNYPVELYYELQTIQTINLPQYGENVGQIQLWQSNTVIDFENIIKPSKIKYDIIDLP